MDMQEKEKIRRKRQLKNRKRRGEERLRSVRKKNRKVSLKDAIEESLEKFEG